MKKKPIEYIIKAIIYIIAAVASYFGVSSFTSCTVQRAAETRGRAVGVFHYVDTFYIDHGGDVRVSVGR